MISFAADENLNNNIVRGVSRLNPSVDIVRVQDVGLSGADDHVVLDWAAQQGRVLLTHDISTMTKFAYERVRLGLPMPGVFEVSPTAALGRVIEDIVLLAESSLPNEWEGQVRYFPFNEPFDRTNPLTVKPSLLMSSTPSWTTATR